MKEIKFVKIGISIIIAICFITLTYLFWYIPHLWLITRDISPYPGSKLSRMEFLRPGSLNSPGPHRILAYCYKRAIERPDLGMECRKDPSLEAFSDKEKESMDNELGSDFPLRSCVYSAFYREARPHYDEWLLNHGFLSIPNYPSDYKHKYAKARIIGYAASEEVCVEFFPK